MWRVSKRRTNNSCAGWPSVPLACQWETASIRPKPGARATPTVRAATLTCRPIGCRAVQLPVQPAQLRRWAAQRNRRRRPALTALRPLAAWLQGAVADSPAVDSPGAGSPGAGSPGAGSPAVDDLAAGSRSLLAVDSPARGTPAARAAARRPHPGQADTPPAAQRAGPSSGSREGG